jgi:hypothetical protein
MCEWHKYAKGILVFTDKDRISPHRQYLTDVGCRGDFLLAGTIEATRGQQRLG